MIGGFLREAALTEQTGDCGYEEDEGIPDIHGAASCGGDDPG